MSEKREQIKDEVDRSSGAGQLTAGDQRWASDTPSSLASSSYSPDPWSDDIHLQARKPSGAKTWALRLGIGTVLLSFVGVLAFGAWSLLSTKETSKRQIVQISLLKPPPPPPPPPPRQKPPEPEVKQEVKVPEPEQPKQEEQAPPPGEQLGLDAEGSGNGDGFGLVAKKGGADITKIGGPSGDGGAARTWFAGLVQSYLQTELSKNERLRHANYKVVIWVWFTPDGHIQRAELKDTTGNQELDKNLKLALDQVPPMNRAPPADIPQPVKLRVTSSGAG
jgi:protein TonB